MSIKIAVDWRTSNNLLASIRLIWDGILDGVDFSQRQGPNGGNVGNGRL